MPSYNNYFPTNYQPYQMPVVQQPVSTPQQQNTSIVWVQGEAGAKAYPVAAGNSVMLLDSENSVFYIKSTDVSGMPLPLRTFDFTERNEQPKAQPVSFNPDDFVSKKEFNAWKESFMRRKEKHNGKSAE